jgi:hypothetical protein
MRTRTLAAMLGATAIAMTATAGTTPVPDKAKLDKLSARFQPVDLTVDVSKLPANERASLAKQVEAAKLMDALFLRQVWAGNEALLLSLLTDESPLGRARLQNYLIHKGPWDRVEHHAAMIPGVPAKPEGGNFYAAGATKVS